MAKIIDFLDSLSDKNYSDGKLRSDGEKFGLSEAQIQTVTSHDQAKIAAAIEAESGKTQKGRVVRVVM